MFSDEDIEVLGKRLGAWSEVLGELARPEPCRELLTALDTGDGAAFHDIVGRWPFFERLSCIELVDTFTRFAHTGDYQTTHVCSFVNVLRPLNPSPTTGRGYQLADGRVLWLTEAEWWQMMDQAVADESWRVSNRDLLVAVGILTCHIELVPTIQRFDVTKRYQICPPTGDPHERPAARREQRRSMQEGSRS